MRIAIIGGGIGGLSTALALRQSGFAPDVFEQAPELLEVGAAIAVWPNAMRILQRLGVGETVLQHAGVIEQVRWLNQDGRLIREVRLPPTDAPAVALHRAELQSELLHALPEKSIHLGHPFEAYDREGDTINARFADGSLIECDMLVGADGLHSHVRAQLLGDAPPSFRGYTTWRGVTDSPPSALTTDTAIDIYGRGKRFGIGPVGQGRIGWWATANQSGLRLGDGETGRHGDPAGASTSQPCDRQELLSLFDGWCEPVRELIQTTQSTSMVKNLVFDRPSTGQWGAGRVTLLGDAVHPTTPNLGQGGCLAIEDAVVLARSLNQHCPASRRHSLTDIETALRHYERLRYRRTTAIANYSRRYGAIGQWDGAGAARLRSATLSVLPRPLIQRLFQMIFSYEAYSVRV